MRQSRRKRKFKITDVGRITEALRIAAALASAWKLPINPYLSDPSHNMAATIHFLSALGNSDYFEADVAKINLFRDKFVSTPFILDANNCVHPLEEPGIGLEVDEEFLTKHPVIEGPCYV